MWLNWEETNGTGRASIYEMASLGTFLLTLDAVGATRGLVPGNAEKIGRFFLVVCFLPYDVIRRNVNL